MLSGLKEVLALMILGCYYFGYYGAGRYGFGHSYFGSYGVLRYGYMYYLNLHTISSIHLPQLISPEYRRLHYHYEDKSIQQRIAYR